MIWNQEQITFLGETRNLLSSEAHKLFKEKFNIDITYAAFSTKKSKLGFCSCESKKLKWKSEYINFMQKQKEKNSRNAYKEFIAAFPDSSITETAFLNERSRLGISEKKPHKTNKRRALYSESTCKKYTMIKVAEPAVWISKTRFIYEKNHPDDKHEKGDQYFHANGDKEDYTPDNIIKVHARERTLFIAAGGVSNDPEVTKINLLQARLKLAQLDAGEKIGLVKDTSAGRKWIAS